MNVPETLQSQTTLDKLTQTRVRNLLAQPTTAPVAAAPAPAPPTDAPATASQGE